MSGFTFSHSGDPTETYTIKAATIYGSTGFIVDKATLHVPYEALPVAMLILWLCGDDFTLRKIYEARLDLRPEYDCDSDEDIQQIEAVDEIEAWYWLYKLAHDTKLIGLRDEVAARYLNAINTGTPWLIGDLWERLDDVYQSKIPKREALHSVTAMIVKKLTLFHALCSKHAETGSAYRHDIELAAEQIYDLEWTIATKCCEIDEAARC